MNIHSKCFCVVSLLLSCFNRISANDRKFIGNYTAAERKAINKFRLLVEPDLYRGFMREDEYLIHWIRDQKFNLQNAKDKLLRSLQWRKKNKIDSILTEDFADILKLCPYNLNGRDRNGRPVMTFDIGTCPIRKIALTGNHDRLYRTLDYVFEQAFADVLKLQSEGKSVEDVIVIGNLNGFSWRENFCVRCLPFTIKLITLYEEHYPQYVYKLIAINAPRVFGNVLPIVMPLLSERTRNIVNIYGHDRKEWEPVILKLISPEQIEKRYGGTKQVTS